MRGWTACRLPPHWALQALQPPTPRIALHVELPALRTGCTFLPKERGHPPPADPLLWDALATLDVGQTLMLWSALLLQQKAAWEALA